MTNDRRTWEPPGLPLAPESKGNSHKIGRRGGRHCIVNSPQADAFKRTAETWFRAHRPPQPFALDDKLALCVIVQYPDYRKDADIELVADAIEMAGVIPNDRQIRDKRCVVLDNTGAPMTWVQIEVIGKLPWKSTAGKRIK